MEITKFQIKKMLLEHLVSHKSNLSEEEKEFVVESMLEKFKDLGKSLVNLGKVTRRFATGAPRIEDLRKKQIKSLDKIKNNIKTMPTANLKRRFITWYNDASKKVKDAKDYEGLEISLDQINSNSYYNDTELNWLRSQTQLFAVVQEIKANNDIIIDAMTKEL